MVAYGQPMVTTKSDGHLQFQDHQPFILGVTAHIMLVKSQIP